MKAMLRKYVSLVIMLLLLILIISWLPQEGAAKAAYGYIDSGDPAQTVGLSPRQLSQ